MTNLEYINEQIEECSKVIEHLKIKIIEDSKYLPLVKMHNEEIENLTKLKYRLQQIKVVLEAWEVVKEELQIVSRGKNRRGEKLQRYELCVLGQDKINTLEKGLGIEKC